uniref:ORF4b n=1 Tax=Middle East respiratory syndrome-related coronavirus TaxID=1335626 RepID=A0A2R4KP90_MERS|nr:ORF4b [Middle East respiratory syndrome-related coronavirus]
MAIASPRQAVRLQPSMALQLTVSAVVILIQNFAMLSVGFLLLNSKMLWAVGHPAPTHYLRVVFPPSRNWDVRSGHMLDDVQRWLAPYGAKPVTEYHITIALLICKPDQQFHNFSYLAHMLTDVVFELSDFHILGRTLVLNANECQHPNMTVHHIKEWLRVYGYTIYNSHLPLHLSVSKLHDLDDATRSYIGSTAYIKQYTTRILAKPTALELVTIRGTPNNPKQIVQSIPIF